MAWHHPPWTARTVRRRRAWHDITAVGQHTRLATSGVACHHRPWTEHTVGNVWCGMTSPPLDSTHGWQRRAWTSEVALHHRPWAAHTVELRRAWHDITLLGLHARLDDVGRGMTSPPLDSTHGRRRQAWHVITALGQHTRSDDVGRGMPSSPLGSTHGRTMLGVE